ncbi:hypothetical protein [Clostridium sp. C8-1-8]|nr:hypothetical protein [Clostridium sp. C8-1-8]
MHKDLEITFNKAVNILKENTGCKVGWHFSSVGRGTSDVYIVKSN